MDQPIPIFWSKYNFMTGMVNRLINLGENQLDFLVDKLQGLRWKFPKSQFSGKLKAFKMFFNYYLKYVQLLSGK